MKNFGTKMASSASTDQALARDCVGVNRLGVHELSQQFSTLYQPHFAHGETEARRVETDFRQAAAVRVR